MSDLSRVVTALREFAAARDWSQFHDPKNLSMVRWGADISPKLS